MRTVSSRARATARANIALAKYWGKSDVAENVPAVPSVSLTLDRLVTRTEVRFDPTLDADEVFLDGTPELGRGRDRVLRVLDRIRSEAKLDRRAVVTSTNAFPTAAGLASSASGFCALVAATRAAAGLDWDERAISRTARWASASAARSVWGGFVELPAGKPGQRSLSAKPLFAEDYWDVRVVVALAAKGPKAVGSTEGMERSRKTSPLYDAWLGAAAKLTRTIKRGLARRDLPIVGQAMEQSTMAFHSCAHTSAPPVMYWRPPTVAAYQAVLALRDRGVPVYATMDAGPHVKAFCEANHARAVANALKKVDGVLDVFTAKPGRGLEVR